jgi:hypothetical protein
MNSFADSRTCRAAAIGNAAGEVDCSVFAIMSGSSTGIARKTSEFQCVRVVLPEPLAPAMMVSLGRFNGARNAEIAASVGSRQGFLASAFFQKPLQRERLGPSSLRVRASSQPWLQDTLPAMILDRFSCVSILSLRTRKNGAPRLSDHSSRKWPTRPSELSFGMPRYHSQSFKS